MSDDPAAAAPPRPAPPSRAPEPPPPAPNGSSPDDDAVAAVAGTTAPTNAQQSSALAYFMGEAPPPARDTRIPLEVDFGELGAPNFQRCVFRTLRNEELVKCEQQATQRREDGVIERIDPFTRWSYVFAYACVEPNLGQALQHRREHEDDREVKKRLVAGDTATLVREVFGWEPGIVQHVAIEIERRSRYGEDKERAVREIEAGKGSS